MAADYYRIRKELMGAGDELILLRYLKPMIETGASWPQHFAEDADVFNKNPITISDTAFVIVKPRTETCGKTDGCEYGSWRIMARDKMIKNEETGKLIGFKKILKFCVKKKTTSAREYKRSWVMEEYRLLRKWNPKQDHVICKIRLLFQAEIGFLVAKHLSYSSGRLPPTQSLPAYGYRLSNGEEVGAYYLQHLISFENELPSYVTNDVYCMHPTALVDPHQDQMFSPFGICIFANRTEGCGYTDGCDRGCWRIMEGDKPISWITGGSPLGYKRVFRFCEKDGKGKHFYPDPSGEVVWLNWIMEEYRLAEEVMKEYRLAEEVMKDKVLCVIKLQRDELMAAGDELILSRYLKPMIENGASWPQQFVEDADVFSKNPSKVFSPENTVFVIVNPRTEACGKTDGCDYGSWRIMARDKMIKDEETGKLLGFKRILKFYVKKTTSGRDYKRSWVMEEYRHPNPNQDRVICKIRLLFQTEIGFLLAKHFSYSSGPLPATRSLPAYGYDLPNKEEEGAYYLQKLVGRENEWPSYVTNDVYRMHPSALVVPYEDEMFAEYGICIFANRTEASGYTDGCDRGCWRIMTGDKPISSDMGVTFGYMREFKFCEEDDGNAEYFFYDPDGEVVWMRWYMEEYRLAEEVMKDKVLCIIKLQRKIDHD
ncbi:NAC domain-containing protein [Hirschfeldia incana]|nr:NAC domain-containing protein [Hirschfeldia incana]